METGDLISRGLIFYFGHSPQHSTAIGRESRLQQRSFVGRVSLGQKSGLPGYGVGEGSIGVNRCLILLILDLLREYLLDLSHGIVVEKRV